MTRRTRIRLIAACGLLAATAAAAQNARDNANLAVWATTQNMVIPGLSKLPPGLKLEDLPAEARAAFAAFGGPQKQLEVRLWSPGAAPGSATASLDIPPALKLGATLPLEIERPAQRAKAGAVTPGALGDLEKMEIRQYWGCSETVRPGQPKVLKFGDIAGGPNAELFKRYASGGGYVEKPDWTSAHWPNAKKPSAPIAKEASLQGDHKLRTSYLGEVAFKVTQPVDFLDPVVFTSPATEGSPDLKRTIPVAWKPIPGALGYQVFAFAPKGRTVLIMWSGAENSGGNMAGATFPSMDEVKQMVDKGLALPPSKTSCSIPAGIFEGCQTVSLQCVAYGPGQAFESPGAPAVRVQTRSTGMLNLGGAGFGG